MLLEPITFQEPTTPWSPRFRWLKRSGWIVAATLLFLVLLRISGGWLAQRRLSKIVAEIHARGEPIERADFDLPPIPDSQNAAWYYRQAFAANINGTVVDSWTGWNNPIVFPLDRTWLMDPFNSNPVAVNWARQAQNHDTAIWYSPIRRWLIALPQPDLNRVRSLENDLSLDAWREHQLGQENQALDDLHAMHHLADATQQNFPSVVSNLVGFGVDFITSDAALGLSRDLQIGKAQPAASRQDVLDLIADLSDERQLHGTGSRFLIAERATTLDTQQSIAFFPQPLDFIFKPIMQSDTAAMMDWMTADMPAWSAPNYQAALTMIPPLPTGIDIKMNPMLIGRSNYKRALLIYFADLASRRAAVLALAIRLYRHDHNEHWPATLTDLVPAELPSLPIDPFAPDGATFRYHPDAPAGPILYSVGANGIDDGGKEIPSSQKISSIDGPSIVYHLTARPSPH